jgi:PAS domain S-box-containing protein
MPNTPPTESAHLLAEELIQKRQVRGLQSVSLVMLVGLPLLLGLSVLQDSPSVQLIILTIAIVIASLSYWLLRRGHYLQAGHLLVFSLIPLSAAGIYAFGSTRSAVAVGFTAAIVAAGMNLGKRALILAVALSAGALGALTWAELSGLLVKPDFTVSLRFWLLNVMLLTGIAISIFSSRQVVLRALSEQKTEFKRREQAEQAEQALSQSEDRFRRIFRSSPAAIVVQAIDRMTVLDVNPAFERMFGYSRDEFMGRSDAALWDKPEARKTFIRQMEAAGRVINFPVDARTKDGPLLNTLLSTEIEGHGQARIVVSTITDVTEQKRHEALLIDMARGLSAETGEAFFRSVVQHLGKAIGADLVIAGETSDDRSVSSLAMVQDGLLQPAIRYALAGTPCDVALSQGELRVYGEDVQQLFPQDPFLVDGGFHAYVGVALHDADGSPIGIVNALWRKPQPPSPDRDALVQIFASRITAELVRLRRDREILRLNETLEQRVNERTDQLRATNAELDSFGYSVSHDLQSPLRSIEGFSVLLARRLKGRLSDEEQRLFDCVRVNVVRMHELINDLLALARASKGKLELDQVNLSAMAQQIIAQQRRRDPQRQVQVTIAPGISARCDGKFARIILENLISNAWKYSRKRTSAQIEFGILPSREGGREMLYVRDNGAGFNMAYSDSLFKPFHRLHHDNEFEGSGIGLATVHRILERHGGTIRADSTEGKGACFCFSFDPRFSQDPA